MVGASARYSCLHTPVEPVTSPYRFFIRPGAEYVSAGDEYGIQNEVYARRQILYQHFSGSGYSTPKVSTVTFFMTWGVRGLSL